MNETSSESDEEILASFVGLLLNNTQKVALSWTCWTATLGLDLTRIRVQHFTLSKSDLILLFAC